jgi:23S rRNA (cytidine1920-2'-O)/16S rRNA (cytidine1409-2'-O)-methyltransferase
MAASKIRADQLLVQNGLAETRERAKRLIMAGEVLYQAPGGSLERVDKPGQQMSRESLFRLKEPERYVSRGGFKLATGLRHFRLDVRGLTALDVGASTGGFTDCLLQEGALRVYAVDVGHGQLHERLRADGRVVVLEGINMRSAPRDLLPERVDLAVVDCSFISLKHILPACLPCLKPGGQILALVKPQFELQRSEVKKGVVRDVGLQEEAVRRTAAFCEDALGLRSHGAVPAGLKGPKGNQEHLLLLSRADPGHLR